jgi:hypothetical protein
VSRYISLRIILFFFVVFTAYAIDFGFVGEWVVINPPTGYGGIVDIKINKVVDGYTISLNKTPVVPAFYDIDGSKMVFVLKMGPPELCELRVEGQNLRLYALVDGKWVIGQLFEKKRQ